MGKINEKFWAMKLSPIGGIKPFEFCKEEGIIGFGWGLNDGDNPQDDIDVYERLARMKYGKERLLIESLNRFKKMKKGDYVWVKGYRDFYLCEITDGIYHYGYDEKYKEPGIRNFKKCIFHTIPENFVPTNALYFLNRVKTRVIINLVSDDRI